MYLSEISEKDINLKKINVSRCYFYHNTNHSKCGVSINFIAHCYSSLSPALFSKEDKIYNFVSFSQKFLIRNTVLLTKFQIYTMSKLNERLLSHYNKMIQTISYNKKTQIIHRLSWKQLFIVKMSNKGGNSSVNSNNCQMIPKLIFH